VRPGSIGVEFTVAMAGALSRRSVYLEFTAVLATAFRCHAVLRGNADPV
jgi:hypothetical protein